MCVQVWYDDVECVITGHQTDPLNYTTPSMVEFIDLRSTSLLFSFLANYLHYLHAFVAIPRQGIRMTSKMDDINRLHDVNVYVQIMA